MDTTYGTHIIVDFWGVPALALNDLQFVKMAMLDATKASLATVLGVKFHRFDPEGISGYVLIAESHLSIHTWPTQGYASIDIYTCGDRCFPQKAMETLQQHFNPQKTNVVTLERGIPAIAIKEETLDNV